MVKLDKIALSGCRSRIKDNNDGTYSNGSRQLANESSLHAVKHLHLETHEYQVEIVPAEGVDRLLLVYMPRYTSITAVKVGPRLSSLLSADIKRCEALNSYP